jgi:lincosamide nucleotidyltransferase B/F
LSTIALTDMMVKEESMNTPLLNRLEKLTEVLSHDPDCLGLLALGSAADLSRMDAYSDLDFFVIVKPGTVQRFLEEDTWLSACAPLAYRFRNTPDGHKALWEDGIYAEYAVFEVTTLASISYTKGRWCFQREGFTLPDQPHRPLPDPRQNPSYAYNEALTNLLVGMMRYRRGERLAGARLIQVHAIDRILATLEDPILPLSSSVDPFSLDRRIEFRHPEIVKLLQDVVVDLDHLPQATLALLAYLEVRMEIPDALRQRISDLCNH